MIQIHGDCDGDGDSLYKLRYRGEAVKLNRGCRMTISWVFGLGSGVWMVKWVGEGEWGGGERAWVGRGQIVDRAVL